MDDNLLSILIPTYNRSLILDNQLSYLIELQKEISFKIIISDNCSDDNTNDIVVKWQSNGGNILYFHQDTNVGYDRNVYKCVSLVETDYFWILGDSTVFNHDEFCEIYSILKRDSPNAILINAYDKISNVYSQYYNDADRILFDLGWNLSHLSSLIISKEASVYKYFERYFDTNFLHLGLFFEYVVTLENPKVFYYHKNPLVHSRVFSPNIARNTWAKKKYEIFCEDWFYLIMSLPNQIKNETKLKCIMDHSRFNNFFSYERIVRDRAKNYIDKQRFKQIEMLFPFVSDTPVWFVKLMNFIPLNFFSMYKRIFIK
jgi:glycosyltransferase involved in cell wall biosynthesis